MNSLEFNIYSNALVRITELILSDNFDEIRYGDNQYSQTPIRSFILGLDWVIFDRKNQKFTKIVYNKGEENNIETLEVIIPPFMQDVLSDLYE